MNIFDDHTFTIKDKSGNTVATHVLCQLDGVSMQEGAMLNSQAPYDVYDFMITQQTLPALDRGYLFVDEKNTDSDTGQAVTYRLAGKPNYYAATNHIEGRCIRFVGD